MSYLRVAPFGQSVPRLVGASGSPSTCTTVVATFFALSPSVWMMTPHATAQYGQMLLVSVVRAIFSCRISARAVRHVESDPAAAPALRRPSRTSAFSSSLPGSAEPEQAPFHGPVPALIRLNQGLPSPDWPAGLRGLRTGLSWD